MIGIYKITSPNNKVYIGKSIDLDERKSSYKYEGRRQKQHKLNNSVNKYGWEKHLFEIIEICEVENLNDKEIYWIDFYNSVEEGLNIMYGGQGGKHSQEVKDKKSKSMMGKKPSLETRQKMSQSKKGHLMYDETWRKRMQEGAWKSKASSKYILQYDLDGNFIKEWESKKQAGKELKINPVSIANNTCGISKSAGGYVWKNK
jgi:group I intron endonuclease